MPWGAGGAALPAGPPAEPGWPSAGSWLNLHRAPNLHAPRAKWAHACGIGLPLADQLASLRR